MKWGPISGAEMMARTADLTGAREAQDIRPLTVKQMLTAIPVLIECN
jgi:hypothetical protein